MVFGGSGGNKDNYHALQDSILVGRDSGNILYRTAAWFDEVALVERTTTMTLQDDSMVKEVFVAE